MQSIGFIGGGRVARILIGGWLQADQLPGDLLVHEPDDQVFAALKALASNAERVQLERVAAAEVVFIALHPPACATTLPALRSALRPGAIVISLAPKVTLATLEAGCGTGRVVRVIPNAPSLVGQGYNPMAYGQRCDSDARGIVAVLMSALGQAPEVDEGDLEAYAILSGMGPTYFWYQFDALRCAVRGLGLKDQAIDAALRATVAGSLATLLDSGLPPEGVMDLVPVKPLAGQEPVLRAAYLEALPALHAKIRPAPAPVG
jgi:pyrroline-5-carboxylate reductase